VKSRGSEPDPGHSARRDPPPRPTWVLALMVVVAALLLAIVVAVLLVGGEHGPGRHSMGSGAGQLSVDAAQ
jgi:hypothetical protein